MIDRRAMAVGSALVVAGALTLKVCLRSTKREARPGAAASSATVDAGADRSTGGRPDGPVSAGPPGMLHLDPHRTNRSAFLGPSTPNVVWTFDTGGPIEAAPVMLADGTIVVASL